MSILLAIETSVPEASIALSIDGEIVATQEFESHRQQNKLLFPALDTVLQYLRSHQLTPDQIIVGTGPGSYSGSRISIAAAHGLAIAYSCPVAGLGSLLATPSLQTQARAFAIGDARRDSYFIAEIHQDSSEFTPELMDHQAFIAKLSDIDPSIPRISFEHELPVENFLRETPHATRLISAWNNLPQTEREKLNTTPPQPLYLRAPFITKAKPGHPLLRRK